MCARVTRHFRQGGHESVKGPARETTSGALRWPGTIKSKPEGSWIYIGRNAARSRYQKLRSCYQITARPCHPEEQEYEQQKREMRFFENNFSLDFLKTFWLSYSTHSIITGSASLQFWFALSKSESATHSLT